jgi:hypothetical protein
LRHRETQVSCGEIVHASTTGPRSQIGHHLREISRAEDAMRVVLGEIGDLLMERRAATRWGDPAGDDVDRVLGIHQDGECSIGLRASILRSMADPTDPGDPIPGSMERSGLGSWMDNQEMTSRLWPIPIVTQ